MWVCFIGLFSTAVRKGIKKFCSLRTVTAQLFECIQKKKIVSITQRLYLC